MSTPSPPAPRIPGLEHVRRLGAGGFADVHLYRQELPRMLVAVKVLRTAAGDLREQLVAEANTMAELAEHPYIVTVLRADVTDDGRPYLVMAYYPGTSLAARARRSPLSVAETLRAGVQLASAVETAHRAGVLHRDIKPANVLLTSYGTPVLADFGIAGRTAEVDDEDDVGVSVAWAPPEVLRGRSNGSVAADVYSLSATLSYLLTGRTPFEDPGGDNSADALLVRTTREPPRRTGREDVPEALERLLQHGMAKDPAHRPGSALALALDLQRVEAQLRLPRTETVVLDHDDDGLHTVTGDATSVRSVLADTPDLPPVSTPQGPPSTPNASTPGHAPSHRPRWPWVAAAAAAAVLLVGGAVGGAVLLLPDDEQSTAGTTSATSSGTEGSSTQGSGTQSSSTAGQTDAALDPCLVGTWETSSYEETVPLLGTLTDLERTMTFGTDGRLTTTYDDARPKGAGAGWVFDGTVVYDVTTSGSTMSFTLVRDGLTVTGPSGDLPPGTGDVQYTCSGDTFTQTATGLDATFTRR